VDTHVAIGASANVQVGSSFQLIPEVNAVATSMGPSNATLSLYWIARDTTALDVYVSNAVGIYEMGQLLLNDFALVVVKFTYSALRGNVITTTLAGNITHEMPAGLTEPRQISAALHQQNTDCQQHTHRLGAAYPELQLGSKGELGLMRILEISPWWLRVGMRADWAETDIQRVWLTAMSIEAIVYDRIELHLQT
jgi:hypothetical protein